MNFSFNVNLEWLASLNCAISLWEKPLIKKKIKEFFRNNKKEREVENLYIIWVDEIENYKPWAALIQEVIADMDRYGLPDHLALELRQKIITIGNNIYKWNFYVTENLQFKRKAADVIYWTPYGTVNQSKIFRDIWSKDDSLFSSCKFSWLYVACITGSLDLVANHSDAAIEILNRYCSFSRDEIGNHRRYRLLTCVLKYLNYNVNEILDNPVWFNPKNIPYEVNFFRICVLEGCIDGVKYFWDKMTDLEHKENIYFAVTSCGKMYFGSGTIGAKTYSRHNYIEVLAFLLNKAPWVLDTVNFYDQFLMNMIEMFAGSWPWEQFFMPVVCEKFRKKDITALFTPLWILATNQNNEHRLGYDCKRSGYRKYFERLCSPKILSEMPKKAVVELQKPIARTSFTIMLALLLHSCDFRNFKLIFMNCMGSESDRRNLLTSHMLPVFEKWVTNEKFDLLQKFTDEVLTSEAERFYFKRDVLNFYSELIMSGSLDTVDKLLDWQKTSDEDKNMLKRKINAEEVCQCLAKKGNHALKDQFISWYFNWPENIKALKEKLGTKNFLQAIIWKYWTNAVKGQNDTKIAEQKSRKLLAVFLDPEEIIVFKKDLITENKIAVQLLLSICRGNCSSLKVLEEFFRFCTDNSEERMIEVKQFFKNHLNRWIDYIAVTMFHRFDLAQALVSWIAKDGNEKVELIQNYMSNLRAVMLCNSLLKRHVYNKTHFVSFLNIWVKPCKNIREIKCEWKIAVDKLLQNNNDDSILLSNAEMVPKIMYCFDVLEKMM